MTDFLFNGPQNAPVTLLLAHGAGAPMDNKSMTAFAEAFAAEGLRVARFEFAYMASRRTPAGAKPPPRADRVMPEFIAAVDALAARTPLVIGGKSMGGRVASMVAADLHAEGRIAGLVCLGYPFHPPGKPDQLRTAHLAEIAVPTLIVQGSNDPFGTSAEVAAYALDRRIRIEWIEGGDHDLKPKKGSPMKPAEALRHIAAEVAAWARALPPSP